jgi:FAD:protein FMN transferase
VPDTITRCRPLLGTFVEITVPCGFLPAADAAFAAIAHIHARLSFHMAGSDLAAIRRAAPGDRLAVDPETVVVLRLARSLFAASRGLFDVCVGRELVRGGFLPGDGLEPLDAYPGSTADILIEDDRHIRLARRVLVDLGGIAKGHAVDRAVAALIAAGVPSGLVNAGGDLRGFGAVDWIVGLNDADGVVRDRVAIRDGALATSANLLNRTAAGTPHIGRGRQAVAVDHRVTVAAETCIVADAMTKIAMVDPDLADTLLKPHGGQVLRAPVPAGA